MRVDKSHRPRCLLWHGWLPLLSGANGESPWAATAGDAAVHMCLRVLLAHTELGSVGAGRVLLMLIGKLLLVGCLRTLMFGLMVVLFVMRFLGLLLLALVFMRGCMLILGGTGGGDILKILAPPQMAWLYHAGALFLDLFRLFRGLSFSGVILALQASDAVHLGVDILNVVRHVGRLLGRCSCTPHPLELEDDGDFDFPNS